MWRLKSSKTPSDHNRLLDVQQSGTPRSASPDSPLIKEIDNDLRATFATGRPMEDKADLIQCKHCKKPMLKSVAAPHMKLCLQKKKEREQKKKEQKEAARKAREAREKGKDIAAASDAESTIVTGGAKDATGDADSASGEIKTAKKSAAGPTDKSKKRKAETATEGEKEPKKKKTKKEIEAAKVKVAKPKGPVDVEKQCGVLLANGAFCARSLTCKSHAMGAKRAVPGRSLPYDMLLQAYQKKNQAKQQSKCSSSLRCSDICVSRPGFLALRYILWKYSTYNAAEAAIDAIAPLVDDIAATGPVDSDEERDLVMAAIARSRPRPMDQHIFVPMRKKYAFVRMKEMLSNALGGSRGGGMFGNSQGMAAPPPVMAGVGTGLNGGDASTSGEGSGEATRRASTTSQGPRPGVGPVPLGLPVRKVSIGGASVAA